MENDQSPVRVRTNSRTMEIDQPQLAAAQGPSPLERYGHEGPSTVFYLKSVRPEHEGSSSFYEGLPDLDTKRPYLRTMFFEDVKNFEADELFQIQSDTAHQQVNRIIPKRREERETKKSKKLKELCEQSQQWMLDEEVVNQISRDVINGGE